MRNKAQGPVQENTFNPCPTHHRLITNQKSAIQDMCASYFSFNRTMEFVWIQLDNCISRMAMAIWMEVFHCCYNVKSH